MNTEDLHSKDESFEVVILCFSMTNFGLRLG